MPKESLSAPRPFKEWDLAVKTRLWQSPQALPRQLALAIFSIVVAAEPQHPPVFHDAGIPLSAERQENSRLPQKTAPSHERKRVPATSRAMPLKFSAQPKANRE